MDTLPNEILYSILSFVSAKCVRSIACVSRSLCQNVRAIYAGRCLLCYQIAKPISKLTIWGKPTLKKYHLYKCAKCNWVDDAFCISDIVHVNGDARLCQWVPKELSRTIRLSDNNMLLPPRFDGPLGGADISGRIYDPCHSDWTRPVVLKSQYCDIVGQNINTVFASMMSTMLVGPVKTKPSGFVLLADPILGGVVLCKIDGVDSPSLTDNTEERNRCRVYFNMVSPSNVKDYWLVSACEHPVELYLNITNKFRVTRRFAHTVDYYDIYIIGRIGKPYYNFFGSFNYNIVNRGIKYKLVMLRLRDERGTTIGYIAQDGIKLISIHEGIDMYDTLSEEDMADLWI